MTTDDPPEPFDGLFADSTTEPEFLMKLRAHDPEFADHVAAIARTAGRDDTLSAQTKTLIHSSLDKTEGPFETLDDKQDRRVGSVSLVNQPITKGQTGR